MNTHMSTLFPALQKFYNALKQLKLFSENNSFFDNIGCIDTFLSEYRSVTFALQTSLGTKDHPDYIKNREEFLSKDKKISKWLNDQRVTITHKHPFKLKKILRIVIYNSDSSYELKRYEQTVEHEESFEDYFQIIRNTFLSIATPEIYFSVQFHFVDEDDAHELNIFDFIESGITSMWQFLHAMKVDMKDETEVTAKLMRKIDEIVLSIPHRWALDVIDYCYYREGDLFERGESFNWMMPDIRIPTEMLIQHVQQMSKTVTTFYEAFIYLHTLAYIKQNHHIMSTFFVEYDDGTYQTLAFLATIRTTMYRYINRVSDLISQNRVLNVYLVTEAVAYGINIISLPKFLQLNYKEKMAYRTKTFLMFYKVSQIGEIDTKAIDSDSLIDRLSVSVAIGRMKSSTSYSINDIMLSPIVEQFKTKLR